MRGHIRKRGKNSWAIVLDLGRDENGKRKQRWHTIRGSAEAAETEMTRLLNTLNTGLYVEPTRITVGEYLARWLEDSARPNVAAKTFERYEEIVKLHLKPELGKIRLTKLQPLQIQNYYSVAFKGGRKDKRKGGLSPLTILHHHRVLKSALRQAVKWQLLARNPAEAVDPPRPRHKEMSVLDEAQMATLLKLVRDTSLYTPVLLAVTTGLRRGEILALRWSDVDLKGGSLAVRQSLEQTKAGLAFKEPKTAKARRVVTLPPLTVEALRIHGVDQKKTRLLLGRAYKDHGLICCRADGAPVDPRSLSHGFSALIKKTALPRVRFHDLRHSHATQLLAARV